jgi:hypothetical protein
MISKAYKTILILFLSYLFLLNLLCFLTTLNPKSFINPFFVKIRSESVYLLIKHIVTDTGIIIKKTPKDEIDNFIIETANKYKIDPKLIMAIVEVESKYREYAISRTGAMGLMQVMPFTFFEMGYEKPFNYKENIEAGVKYLSIQLNRFKDLKLALSAYNAGPKNVLKHMAIPDFIETKSYISKILKIYTPNEDHDNKSDNNIDKN